MLVTLYKIGEVYFRLLPTNGFHVKAENERFDCCGFALSSGRTSNMKISRRRLTNYAKNPHQKACRTCSKIIFPHSTNEIIDLLCCRCRSRHRFQTLSSQEQIESSPYGEIPSTDSALKLSKCRQRDGHWKAGVSFSLGQFARPPFPH